MTQFTLIDKAFLLKKTILFGHLDLDLLLTIADKMGVIEFDQHDPIFVLDEEASRMYFIAKGEILIRNHKNQTVAILKENQFFGEESLFNEKGREYEAIAKTDAVLLSLSRTHLLATISECPSVGIGFLRLYLSNIKCREDLHS